MGRLFAFHVGAQVGDGAKAQVGQFGMMVGKETGRAFGPVQDAGSHLPAIAGRQSADVAEVEAGQGKGHDGLSNGG